MSDLRQQLKKIQAKLDNPIRDPKCPFCGERFSEPTMSYHMMDCPKNPKNIKIAEAKAKAEAEKIKADKVKDSKPVEVKKVVKKGSQKKKK